MRKNYDEATTTYTPRQQPQTPTTTKPERSMHAHEQAVYVRP